MIALNKQISIGVQLLILLCLFITLKQVNAFFPSFVTPSALLLGSLIVANKVGVFHLSNAFPVLILYFVVLFLNYFTGDLYFDSLGDIVEEATILFFCSSLSLYFINTTDTKSTKLLIILILLILIYSCITSFLVNLTDSGIIRNSVYMINTGNIDEVNSLYRKGLVPYQLPHALPILIPPLISGIKERSIDKKTRILFIFALIAILIIVYISNATTAFILSCLMLFLSIMVNDNISLKGNITIIIMILLIIPPILIILNVLEEIIIPLLSSEDASIYEDKFLSISESISSGQEVGSVAARQEKYDMSFSLILENLLFGTNLRTGEHSAIFDRLACLGLIGWIPYIYFIYRQVKFHYTSININKRIYYLLGVLAGLIMLSTKNMSNWYTWFFLLTIMPLMLWHPSKQNIE